MNLPTKVCLGAGAFLVMSGGLLALTGAVMGGRTGLEQIWHPRHGQEEAGSPVDRQAALSPFTALDVDLDLGDVRVETGEDYGISIQQPGGPFHVEYRLEGDTLKVWSDGEWRPALEGRDVCVTIFLPDGAVLDRADISVDLGGIDLTGVTAETMDLELSMGDLTAEDLTTTKSLSVGADMGDVSLTGCFQGKTDCKLSMGGLYLDTSEPADSYALDLEVSMGELTLDGQEAGHVLARAGGPNELDASCDMGDMELWFG